MSAHAEPSEPPFKLRSLTFSVYAPTLLFAFGQGAIIPFIILFAVEELGATAAIGGLVFALRGIGTMVFDVPAGVMITRFGERRAVLVSSIALIGVTIAAAHSTSVAMYAVLVFCMGATWAVWLLARLTFVSDQVPVAQRGRAIAMLAGTNRIGAFVGPFAGAGIVATLGIGATFYFQAVLAFLALIVLMIFTRSAVVSVVGHEDSAHRRVLGILRDHRKVFMTAGVAAIAIHLLRTGRQIIIPLWGSAVGLDPAVIGLIFGISSGIDMLAFYPVGILMDRMGRKWSAVPCLFIMAAGMMFIPVATGFWSLLIAGIVIGIGNGFGSGIVQTIGADLSPRERRGEFLGVWRLISDVGIAGGSLVISGFIAVTTLGIASVATGGIGILGGLVMLFLVPETLHRREEARQAAPPPEPPP